MSIMIHDEDDIRPRKSKRWTAEINKKSRTRGCNAGVAHTVGYSAASAAIRPWLYESRDEY